MLNWNFSLTRVARFSRILILTAMPLAFVACGSEQDDASAAEPAKLAAQRAGSTAKTDDAEKVGCALEYTDCLLKSWPKVLKDGLKPITECTREAEDCGLFDELPDAGLPGATRSPTCGFELAECYLKNPTKPSACSTIKCP
jgi:hypothetical protein